MDHFFIFSYYSGRGSQLVRGGLPVGPEEDQGAPEGDGGLRRERALLAAVILVWQVNNGWLRSNRNSVL